MSLINVPAGDNIPYEFNVIIEIPMRGDPIKYEVDKTSGAIFVDRFMGTAMHYPCNYGYIPQTLSSDGDPADVLVITPIPLPSGVVVKCRALGVLTMEDESGIDAKVLAVPVNKICPQYKGIESYRQLSEFQIEPIAHFFQHYKDLEKGKWVKVGEWQEVQFAYEEIRASVERFENGRTRK